MKMKVISLMLAYLTIAACSNQGCEDSIVDDVRLADSIVFEGTEYYLYMRTTGWNDKAVYFELYDQKPSFNECSKSKIKPIYDVVYDDYPDVKYVKEINLQLDQAEKLSIAYTTEKSEGISNVYDVKFTR